MRVIVISIIKKVELWFCLVVEEGGKWFPWAASCGTLCGK